ncbi:hypothetical protein CONPUDRAFT_169642 [Coniophora puteana RWD-64-598 SS2]|uniref:Uncharacterized protein n=1 Tax=Coniophora puteana (strain RWD-64-598) TaxID=741705 RepID=A0A5M3M889_CONPW|nr:uncharacterized protein CONPUDRAFT_169642 [Coniophora puteana RWD-64-598 SS2]EIW75257.1 hypothetical protein CONPUDRAFT_169642 [Coniophora puteana RWD-64-598 SS2]
MQRNAPKRRSTRPRPNTDQSVSLRGEKVSPTRVVSNTSRRPNKRRAGASLSAPLGEPEQVVPQYYPPGGINSRRMQVSRRVAGTEIEGVPYGDLSHPMIYSQSMLGGLSDHLSRVQARSSHLLIGANGRNHGQGSGGLTHGVMSGQGKQVVGVHQGALRLSDEIPHSFDERKARMAGGNADASQGKDPVDVTHRIHETNSHNLLYDYGRDAFTLRNSASHHEPSQGHQAPPNDVSHNPPPRLVYIAPEQAFQRLEDNPSTTSFWSPQSHLLQSPPIAPDQAPQQGYYTSAAQRPVDVFRFLSAEDAMQPSSCMSSNVDADQEDLRTQIQHLYDVTKMLPEEQRAVSRSHRKIFDVVEKVLHGARSKLASYSSDPTFDHEPLMVCVSELRTLIGIAEELAGQLAGRLGLLSPEGQLESGLMADVPPVFNSNTPAVDESVTMGHPPIPPEPMDEFHRKRTAVDDLCTSLEHLYSLSTALQTQANRHTQADSYTQPDCLFAHPGEEKDQNLIHFTPPSASSAFNAAPALSNTGLPPSATEWTPMLLPPYERGGWESGQMGVDVGNPNPASLTEHNHAYFQRCDPSESQAAWHPPAHSSSFSELAHALGPSGAGQHAREH